MKLRARVAVIAWLAVVAASLTMIARHVVFTSDLSAFLPAAATREQSLLVNELRDGVASRLILVGIEGNDERAVAAASDALAAALAADAQFASVANGNAARSTRERELVGRWRYLMSPAVTPERYTERGLRDALDEAQRLLASPLAPAVRPLIASDPTGETLRIVERLAGGAREMRHGVWFSGDGRRALLTVATRAPGFDLDAQRAAERSMRDAFARVAPRDATLVLSSPGLLGVESRSRIQRDAAFASSVTLAGVALLLVATYRSLWPTLLSAVPALTGLAVGIVAVALAFGPVHAITLGFGAMLVGEAIDYPTYLFANRAPHERLHETQARIGGTLLLAVATTACGALAMMLSGFRGLAQLGVLVVAGVVVAGLTTRYVLPAITPRRALEDKRARLPVRADRWLPRLRRARWVLALAVLAAVAVLIAKRDALWDDDLASLNPLSADVKTVDRTLRDDVGAPDLRYLVVARGATREAALQASERVAPLLDDAVARGSIAGYELAAHFLPSEATQRRRQAALPDPARLAPALAAAVAASPFRVDAFASFASDVERARTGALLTREDLDGTALALRVDSLLVREADGFAALVPLRGVADPAAVARSLAATLEAGVAFLDLKSEADALVAGYRAQSTRSTLAGLACMLLVLWLGVRSLPSALRLLVPVVAAVLLTAATLAATSQRLTVFHLVASLLVVGVGLNYALFFGRRHASAEQRDLTLLSVGVAGLATLMASISLALTSTPVLRAIGTTTALGAVFAFLASAMLSKEPS
jgi:predicted exporter